MGDWKVSNYTGSNKRNVFKYVFINCAFWMEIDQRKLWKQGQVCILRFIFRASIQLSKSYEVILGLLIKIQPFNTFYQLIYVLAG